MSESFTGWIETFRTHAAAGRTSGRKARARRGGGRVKGAEARTKDEECSPQLGRGDGANDDSYSREEKLRLCGREEPSITEGTRRERD